jgi:hypothetical protein
MWCGYPFDGLTVTKMVVPSRLMSSSAGLPDDLVTAARSSSTDVTRLTI